MCFSASKQRRPEHTLRPSFSMAKKSFRHAEAFFRASKSSEKWGSSSCRTPFPGFPHTPFRPVDEIVPLWGQPHAGRAVEPPGIFHKKDAESCICQVQKNSIYSPYFLSFSESLLFIMLSAKNNFVKHFLPQKEITTSRKSYVECSDFVIFDF